MHVAFLHLKVISVSLRYAFTVSSSEEYAGDRQVLLLPRLSSPPQPVMSRSNSILVLLLIYSPWINSFASDGPIHFNRDIRPILTDNCVECHGPDAAAREADLRLDREEKAVTELAAY